MRTNKMKKINSIVYLGPRAFEEIGGEVVQNVANILEKNN